MKRIARLIGLFSILLVFFVAALVASERVLHRQTARLRDEAIAQRQAQLQAAIDLAQLGAPPWTEATTHALERTLDARIRFFTTDADAAPTHSSWSFAMPCASSAGDPGTIAVSFAPPPAARLLDTVQAVAGILLKLALGVIIVFAAFLFWSIRTKESVEEHATHDRASERAGLQSLRQLAFVSARQGDELERERAERLRIEEDLHIKQLLLTRALEQKIRLGQDLHDGIIQSLYATGLTLEATRPLIASDPAAAGARVAAATQALNSTIRDVRAYINGLSPDVLKSQTFGDAVHVLTRELAGGRDVAFELAVDAPTASGLPEAVRTDLLQVIREAASNSLRHGGASRISIALATTDGRIRLCIGDNGKGFVPGTAATSGHGLENIRARIASHRGTVSIESTPAHGTTVTCTVPAQPLPS